MHAVFLLFLYVTPTPNPPPIITGRSVLAVAHRFSTYTSLQVGYEITDTWGLEK